VTGLATLGQTNAPGLQKGANVSTWQAPAIKT